MANRKNRMLIKHSGSCITHNDSHPRLHVTTEAVCLAPTAYWLTHAIWANTKTLVSILKKISTIATQFATWSVMFLAVNLDHLKDGIFFSCNSISQLIVPSLLLTR